MTEWEPEGRIKHISEELLKKPLDALATYLSLRELCEVAGRHPGLVSHETISVLWVILRKSHVAARRLQYFIYREAAKVVSIVILTTRDPSLSEQLVHTLRGMINMFTGSRRRGISEVLGSLPVRIQGPEIKDGRPVSVHTVEWRDLLEKMGLDGDSVWTIAGRTIIFDADEDHILAIKLAPKKSDVPFLRAEIFWMEHLCTRAESFGKRFDIPRPLEIAGGNVFFLEGVPREVREKMKNNTDRYCAFVYLAHRDYFVYPNDHYGRGGLPPDEFQEVMFRNAWLLGKLASDGMVHSAPIPLFHNRVQQSRRPDSGLYEWHKGGRLDRWLHSCRYPNFGLSGVRDFEHIVSYRNSGLDLYRRIGTHILSLVLVSASYFRNIEPQRFGRDGQGRPVDARDLFDEPLLARLVRGVFTGYYSGFCGTDFQEDMPEDFQRLISRMIQEMGIDRHMDEILRVTDQRAMSDKAFEDFLADNHFSREEISRIKKGSEDLRIMTGPHLGEFGGEISLPELTEFLEVASAMCVSGKYLFEKARGVGSSEQEAVPGVQGCEKTRGHFPDENFS